MPNKFNKAKRHHIPKQQYKVTNWAAYNAALKKRGRIDIFISEELIAGWSETRIHDGHGASRYYSQQAILACHQHRTGYIAEIVQNNVLMAKISYPVVGIDTNFDRIHPDLMCDVFNICLVELPGKKFTPRLEVTSRYQKANLICGGALIRH